MRHLSLFALVACSCAREPTPAPFDATVAVTRQRLAFRAANDAWVASQPQHEVRVGAAGWSFSASAAEGARLSLAPARVTRGEHTVTATWPMQQLMFEELVAPGAVFTEHVRHTAAGVEQSWSFARAPQGEGALTVRVPVASAPTATSREGLVFGALRYGHGTWVDARGTRTHVDARFDDGAIALTVPAGVLEATQWPAVLDPILQLEQPLDAPVFTAHPGIDSNPSVAFDGTNYLVVWDEQETRSGTGIVYGMRVSQAGLPLDRGAFPILGNAAGVTNQGPTGTPVVEFDGTNFLVAAIEQAAGPCASAGPRLVKLRFVTTAGAVMGAPITVNPGSTSCPDNVHRLTLSYANSAAGVYLLGYGRSFGSPLKTVVQTFIVTRSGGVTPTTPISTSTAPYDNPTSSWDGTTFVIFYEDQRGSTGIDIWARRISDDGTLPDLNEAPLTQATGDQKNPITIFNINYLVAWEDTRNGGTDIYLRLMTKLGNPVGAADTQVMANAGPNAAPNVTVAGSDWVLSWARGAGTAGDIMVRGVDQFGALFPGGNVAFAAQATDQTRPALAADPAGRTLIVWRDGSATAADLKGGRLQLPATLLDATPVTYSIRANHERAPAVAFNGTHHLAVWADDRSTVGRQKSVYAARIDLDGGVVDNPPLRVTAAPSDRTAPSVASDGQGWLVTWGEPTMTLGELRVQAAKVSAAGVVDMAPVFVPLNSTAANTSVRPAVTYDGQYYVVAWVNGANVVSTRLTRMGMVVDTTPLTVSPYSPPTRPPSIAAASGAAQSLLAWNTSSGIRARRVLTNGTLGDGSDRVVTTAVSSAPTVAFDGTNFMVAWADERGSMPAIFGARVTGAGVAVDDGGISLAAQGRNFNPTLAFDGWNHLLLFETESVAGGFRDVRAQWLQKSGGALGSQTPLTTGGENELLPVAATTPRGDAVVIYQAMDSTPNVQTDRLRFRGASYAKLLGASCLGAGECTTGFCVDGVCCESTCGGGVKDCQSCNADAGVPKSGSCAPLPSGITCRGPDAGCDAAEVCDGNNTACPADAVLPVSAECRGAAGTCDVPETCDGLGKVCPPNQLVDAGAMCRPLAGLCDIDPEYCTGTSAACPADAFRVGMKCREAAGICDAEEFCDSAPLCPPDLFKPNTTLCRSAEGVCDEIELCTGNSVVCPPDTGCVMGTGGGSGTGGGRTGTGGSGGGGEAPKGCGCNSGLESLALLSLLALRGKARA